MTIVFRDLQVPDDATLPPMTKIQEWRLAKCHLRVCVRLPSGESNLNSAFMMPQVSLFSFFQEPAWKRPRIAEDYGKYLHKDLGTMAPSLVAKTSQVYRMPHDSSQRRE